MTENDFPFAVEPSAIKKLIVVAEKMAFGHQLGCQQGGVKLF